MRKRPVLVCVTAQSSCDVLVEKGRVIAEKLGAPLEVVSVQSVDMTALQRADALDTLYAISKKSSADIVVYYNNDPAETVSLHAKRSKACYIITGLPRISSNGFASKLKSMLKDIPVIAVDENYVFSDYQIRGVGKKIAAGLNA